MLVSRGSPGVSRRWGELSEGGSDENAMAPEAFEGRLTGPDAVHSFSVSTTCADNRRGDAPPPGMLSRATRIRNGVDHDEPRQTRRYQ